MIIKIPISCRRICIPQCVIVYDSKKFSISCRDLRIPQCVIVYTCEKFLYYWPVLASLYFRSVLWQIFPHSFESFGKTIRCRVWCYDKVGNSFFTFIGSGRLWWQKWTQLKIRGVVSNLHLQSVHKELERFLETDDLTIGFSKKIL